MKRSEALDIIRKNWPKDIHYTEALRTLIPELKESDDERIRNFLIDFIKVCGWSEKQYPPREGCIAWLEKQCSQNLANSAKTCKVEQNPIFRVGDYIRNTKTGDKVLIEQLEMATKVYFYVSYDGAAVNHSDFPFSQQDEWQLIGQKIIEQNPAWSEEDEKMIEFWNLYYEHKVGDMPNKDVVENLEKFRDWLRTLKERYTWKPSDEQIKAFEDDLQYYIGLFKPELQSLLNDLKKLKG